MFSTVKTTAISLAAAGLAFTVPASAAPVGQSHAVTNFSSYSQVQPMGETQFEHGRKRDKRWNRGRGYRNSQYRGYAPQRRAYYDEPVYRDTRVWRANDGRYYCQKKDGTTGLLIGGAAGALLGREIAGRGDRTLGAILGAAGGALLGREIDRGGSRCR